MLALLVSRKLRRDLVEAVAGPQTKAIVTKLDLFGTACLSIAKLVKSRREASMTDIPWP